jgi:hypothetical protein
MGYAAKWKVLEDLMLELRKKGFETPSNVISELRSAKNMIKISQAGESPGDATMKLEEILGSVESDLVTEAQNVMVQEEVDEWLKRLDEASLPTCEIKAVSESTLVVGVPKDQRWIRIVPMPNLSAMKLQQIAKDHRLSVNQEKDGRLVVYGQQEGIKAFLKKMTEEAQLKNKSAT